MDKYKAHSQLLIDWRTKVRRKTVGVGVALCLNIGVDPPDVYKPKEHSKLEAWVDPFKYTHPSRALEQIGNNILSQLESWQPRARYKIMLDAAVDDVKKFGLSYKKNLTHTSVNRNSDRKENKLDGLMFLYNGHGVPRPTQNGEFWAFNKNFTQYIPISMLELIEWVGVNALYVFDCSNSGTLLKSAETFLLNYKRPNFESLNSREDISDFSDISSHPDVSVIDIQAEFNKMSSHIHDECYIITSCGVGETLPIRPDFPADLLTSCLTTPIKTAILWHLKTNSSYTNMIDTSMSKLEELIHKIPGKTTDRRSMLGEINWIYTAITDSIAWDCVMNETSDRKTKDYNKNNTKFQKLYRHDLLIASMFRNFLLAQRIFHTMGCTPMSMPPINLLEVVHHPLWNSWDYVLDHFISQLIEILGLNNDAEEIKPNDSLTYNKNYFETKTKPNTLDDFESCDFFSQQLSSFESFLKYTYKNNKSSDNDTNHKRFLAPLQLPIILQVLLSQNHRTSALRLLSEFINLGVDAINACLSVGIFPYILKLLQSPAIELKPYLVFIWFKLCVYDHTCQTDLAKDSSYTYFLKIIESKTEEKEIYSALNNETVSHARLSFFKQLDYKAMSLFVLNTFCSNNFYLAQKTLIENDIITALYSLVCSERYKKYPDSNLNHNFTIDHTHRFQNSPNRIIWTNILIYQLMSCEQNEKYEPNDFRCSNMTIFIEEIYSLLESLSDKTRTSSLFPLSTFFYKSSQNFENTEIQHDIIFNLLLISRKNNLLHGSTKFKLGLLNIFSVFISNHQSNFIKSAFECLKEKEKEIKNEYLMILKSHLKNSQNCINAKIQNFNYIDEPLKITLPLEKGLNKQRMNLYNILWKQILCLSVDLEVLVSNEAQSVVDKIHKNLITCLEEGNESFKKFCKFCEYTKETRVDPSNIESVKSKEVFLNLHLKYKSNTKSDLNIHNNNIKIITNTLRKSASLSLRAFGNTQVEIDELNASKREKEIVEILEWFYQNNETFFRPSDNSKIDKISPNNKYFEDTISNIKHSYMKPNFPPLKTEKINEPGSLEYIKRYRKKTKAEKESLIRKMELEKYAREINDDNKKNNWVVKTLQINNNSTPKDVFLHDKEDILLLLDYKNKISLWDYGNKKLLCTKKLGCFIDKQDSKLEKTSSANNVRWLKSALESNFFVVTYESGDISLHKCDADFQKISNITCIKAINIYENTIKNQSIGFHKNTSSLSKTLVSYSSNQKNISTSLFTEPSPDNTKIAVASSYSNRINIWDIESLQLGSNFVTKSTYDISCIEYKSNNPSTDFLILVGFENGSIKLFDERTSNIRSATHWISKSKKKARNNKIISIKQTYDFVNTSLSKNLLKHDFITCSNSGDIILWDYRTTTPLYSLETTESSQIAIHNSVPILANVNKQLMNINVLNFDFNFRSINIMEILHHYHPVQHAFFQTIQPACINTLKFHSIKPSLVSISGNSNTPNETSFSSYVTMFNWNEINT